MAKGNGKSGKGKPRGASDLQKARQKSRSFTAGSSRSIPWGLVTAVVLVVVFAAGVIGFAVKQNLDNKDSSLANPAISVDEGQKFKEAADKIPGIVTKQFPAGQHQEGVINYDVRPPFGGKHDPEWLDCTGTVYSKPIRDENAVHGLEHGAVWITYRPDLSADEVKTLSKLVKGNNYTMMSPYEGLKTKVSLQAWGYQLGVDDVNDGRIREFVKDLRANPVTRQENGSCLNPDFKSSPRGPDQPPAPQSSAPASSSAPSSTAPAASTPATPAPQVNQ